MGLFDLLFGSGRPRKRDVIADHIWLTEEAKFSGIAKHIEDRSRSDTVAILLVAHFPDVLTRLEELNPGSSVVPVSALLARDLTPELAASLNLHESATIDVIVAERHPLSSVDDRLVEFAEAFPFRCRFTHHLSLDDPLMKVFTGPWVREMLEKLGMNDEEAIESKMVSRRIRGAQQKIEGKSYATFEADSAWEWMRQNCPQLDLQD